MAEEESELELDRFKEKLERLLNAGTEDERGLQSKGYCGKFCEEWRNKQIDELFIKRRNLLVEEYTGHWQVPLPQLQVLRRALCAFVCGTASFPSDCEHVRYTLSSLALSVFELLLFFGRDEFQEDPLKDILDSFQECHSSLVRYQNVYLLQVKHIIRVGGPWASPVLEGILKGVEQPQEEVDRYLSSEVSLFFELRVRYLLACERIQEAMALAQRCSQHSAAGRHLYFKQAYLSCLWKSSMQDRLLTEMAEIDGKDAVEILCIAENEERDEFLLELSRGFLWQQLRSGDMYHLWDLVFIWYKLYLRVKGSKDFLQESKQLILSATNLKAIFPFVKVILTEQLGKEGLIFCVELCAQALQTDLKNDPATKSLLYKTIAYMFPNDLEICRACALLVFFLERTVEAYKTVFLLYNHPDQEYHLDSSPIGNSVRFEVIQILKKGLFFDPEFWSLLNIKTNCLKLMNNEVDKAALCEIMEEDKWVPNYCAQGSCMCHPEPERTTVKQEAKPASSAKLVSGTLAKEDKHLSGETPLYKRRGRKRRSQIAMDLEYFPVRRSFRQLDLAQNHARPLNNRYQKFHTRQVDKSILKRRGRRPRWLVELLAAQAENSAPGQEKKAGRSPKPLHFVKGILDDTPVIEITLEYSYPDNEVELPANVQGLSLSKMSSAESKTQTQGVQAPCENTSNALQLMLEVSSPSWRDNDKITEAFQSPEVIAIIKTFHTYATVSEDKVGPPDATPYSIVKMTPNIEEKLSLELHAPVRNLSEPIKVYTVKNRTLQTAALTKQISAPLENTSKVNMLEKCFSSEMSSVLPVKQVVSQDTVVNNLKNGTLHLPKVKTTCSVTDTTQTPEIKDDSISAFGCRPDEATDHVLTHETSKNTTDICPTSDIVPEPPSTTATPKLVPQTTPDVPIHEKVSPAAREMTVVHTNVSTVESRPKTSAFLEEATIQGPLGNQTVEHVLPEDRPALINSSSCVPSPQPVVQLVHCCRLCNEECTESSVLNHALRHFQTEKNCMFCTSFTCTSGALRHFEKHIKDLGMADSSLETEKLDDLTEPDRPEQTVPKRPQKKPMPGLAQIKSKLLMRLKLTSKTSTQQVTEKSLDANGKPLAEDESTEKAPSTQEPEQSDEKKDQENNVKERIRYMTRGLVRKTEHKGRFLRTRLERKAKTRDTKTGGDKRLRKVSSTHRVNGGIRKTQKIKLKEISRVHSVRAEKSKEQTENNETITCIKTKEEPAESSSVDGRSLNCSKATLQKLDMRKKRRSSGRKADVKDDKDDVKEVKKRKLNTRPNGAGQKRKAEDVADCKTNANIQENETEAKSNENFKPVQKRVGGAYTRIRCPVKTCMFHARANPLLSHILIHHPGDMKTLEFFYNLVKKKNCVFCLRRLWTPQHFFDHIVSHRGNFKHPCYHVNCAERFKTRLEVMEHMVKVHQPLKALCSFPECTVEFNCLKTLYNHERDHYKMGIIERTSSQALRTERGLEEATVSTPKNAITSAQQTPKSTETSAEGTEQGYITPVIEDDKLSTANKSSVTYSNKSPRLVNGHSDHQEESGSKATDAALKEEETKFLPVTVKPFVRPPPSSYLDEMYLSMPKRRKELQISPTSSVACIDSPSKRQRCSRCALAFDSEDELKQHREKCTSLFGFDSDEENSF